MNLKKACYNCLNIHQVCAIKLLHIFQNINARCRRKRVRSHPMKFEFTNFCWPLVFPMDGRLHVIKWILAWAFFQSSSSLYSLKMVIFRRHFEREAAMEFVSFLAYRPPMTCRLKWKNKKVGHLDFFWTWYFECLMWWFFNGIQYC